jgi:hypothetical protein
MRKLILAYTAFGALAVGGYGISDWYGLEWPSAKQQKLDPNIRRAPGGWRAYSFWHSGSRGGK